LNAGAQAGVHRHERPIDATSRTAASSTAKSLKKAKGKKAPASVLRTLRTKDGGELVPFVESEVVQGLNVMALYSADVVGAFQYYPATVSSACVLSAGSMTAISAMSLDRPCFCINPCMRV
jgi:hypothetical protein